MAENKRQDGMLSSIGAAIVPKTELISRVQVFRLGSIGPPVEQASFSVVLRRRIYSDDTYRGFTRLTVALRVQ